MPAAHAIAPGQALPRAEILVTQAMIDRYAAISGDFNPVHVDPGSAGARAFGGTIAHGCIPMEPLFRALLRLLGRPVLPFGTAVTLRYRSPVRPGDRVHVEGQVAAPDGQGCLRIDFACVNGAGTVMLDGSCRLPEEG